MTTPLTSLRLVEMKAAEGEWNHGGGPALKPISLLRMPAAWLLLAGDPKPPCPTPPSYVTPDNLSPSPVHGLQPSGHDLSHMRLCAPKIKGRP